jgi:hypothetical protein
MTWLAFLRRGRNPTSRDEEEPAGPCYRLVRDLSVRLMNGERIALTDERGRRWQATRNALLCVSDGGECAATIDGDVFDVAAALARLIAGLDEHRTTTPASLSAKPTPRSGP